MFLLGLVIGLVVGGGVGLLAAGLCAAGADS